MELDIQACAKRNVHGRTETQIAQLVERWEETPKHHLHLDATSLLQAGCIAEVEMDLVSDDENVEKDGNPPEGNDDDNSSEV